MPPTEVAEASAPEFFALAYRLPAYQGVMAARVAEQRSQESRNRPRRGVRQVEGSREAVQRDPFLAEAISFS